MDTKGWIVINRISAHKILALCYYSCGYIMFHGKGDFADVITVANQLTLRQGDEHGSQGSLTAQREAEGELVSEGDSTKRPNWPVLAWKRKCRKLLETEKARKWIFPLRFEPYRHLDFSRMGPFWTSDL